MKKKQIEQDYTFMDIVKAREDVRQEHFYILQYLINKNSKSINEGGVNYQQFFEDMQDFEQYLIEN